MLAKFGYDADEPLFFIRYWRGDGPLWKVFWLHGVLASLGIVGAYFLAVLIGDTGVQRAVLIVALIFAVWIAVSVWRCALNVCNVAYAYIARGLAVAWAINAVILVITLSRGRIGAILVCLGLQ